MQFINKIIAIIARMFKIVHIFFVLAFLVKLETNQLCEDVFGGSAQIG